MSRKIKFRAWVLKDRKMIQHRNRAPAVKMFAPDYGYTNKEVIVMQYTGLKDENGVEIWEGDLLKWDGDRIKESKLDSDYLIEVKLSDYLTIELVEHTNEFMFRYDTDGYDLPYFLTEAEVIGNTYEHPHLIEEETE